MSDSFKDIPKSFLEKWQNISDLLAKIVNVPAALIMKNDNEYLEVFISSNSDNNPYHPGDKEHWYGLYCETVIKSQKELNVPNALKDENWDKNPDIKLGMIAYLGIPINLPDQKPFGTICVLDDKENEFSDEHKALLYQFKNVIELDLALIQNLDLEKGSEDFDIIHKLKVQNEEYLAANEELIESNNQLYIEKEKVKASERHFRLLVENSPIAIFIQTEGKFSYVNKAAIDLYGAHSEAQLLNSYVLDRVHSDYRDVVKQRIKALNEKKIPANNIAYKHLTIDNTAVDVEVSAVPFSSYGKDGALVFVHDISERKKLTQQIIDKEQNLNNIFTNSPAGIFVIDIDENGDYLINSINPAHENLLGIKNEQVKGQPLKILSELYNTELYEYVKKLYDKIVASKESLSFEEATKVKNELIQSKTTIKPLLDENGRVYRLIGTNVDISEIKESEKKLIEAKNVAETTKNNWQITFDAIEDIVMLLSNEHGIIEINKAGIDSLGIPKDEIIGKKCFHLVHNTSQPIVECPCVISKQEKKSFKSEYQVNDKTYSLTAYPVLDVNSNVKYFSHIVKDITKTKLDELKISSLSRIIENSLNEIYIFDRNTFKFKFANKGAIQNIGYTLAELRNLTPVDLKPEFSFQQFKNIIAPLIKNETEIVRTETIHKRKNASIYDISLNIQLAEYDNDEVLVAFITDISNRKKVEKEILRQKNLFETMFNTIEEGVVITNINREIVLANSGMFSTFGFQPEEIIGKKTKILYADADKFEETGNAVFNKEAAPVKKSYLTSYKSKDGRIFSGETFGSKLYDENGTWIGNIGIMRDVTERENFISELSKAKQKAEESNRLKSEFLANMSHEVRTPMNGIIGFSEILDNPDITNERRSFCAKIVQESSHQLLRIIDDILEISTLETKQITLNNAQFDLSELFTDLYSIFKLKANSQNIDFILREPVNTNNLVIITDKSKLYKIISNLIENALKFTTEGFVEIGYSIKNEDLLVYVKDSGIGIYEESKEIIFERFSQEEKELSRKYGGLGLGLSISKENAQLLGGNITFESEKGKGSTFFLTIPYKSAQAESEIASKNFNNIKMPNDKYTILIAEDEEINYLYIAVLFEDEIKGDYKLLHAKNGREAVEMCISNNEIDLVLMDIKMPIMSGHEATEKIKEKFPNLPIIAQSAYSTESDRQLAIKHGCNDFISKPLNREKLFEMIYKYLKMK